MKNKNGFTLIELIIVLSFISIVSCIILPSFHFLEKASLRKAALELKMNIRYGQKRALKENKKYWIKFYNLQNLYTVSSNTISSNNVASENKKIQLSSDIQMEEVVFNTPKNIEFTRKGTTGSSGHIYLRSKHFRVKITVIPGTGKVNVYEIVEQ